MVNDDIIGINYAIVLKLRKLTPKKRWNNPKFIGYFLPCNKLGLIENVYIMFY